LKQLFLILMLVSACISCSLFNPYDNIDDVIVSRMDAFSIPGLSAVIVNKNGIVWENNYGYRGLGNSLPVTEETLFSIGSVSKLITATAIMILEDNGDLDLETDINNYLPFSVRHPDYNDTAITVRMLLSHSSAIISDRNKMIETPELWDLWQIGDSYNMDMHLLEEYLTPGEIYYEKDKNFADFKPGTDFVYSNIGTALLAFIVEEISGTDFPTYCQTNIFDPLLMEGSWFYSQVDPANLAFSYSTDLKLLNFEKMFDWPAGSYVISAHDFSKFMQLFLNNGSINGTKILKPETVEKMLTAQNDGYALQWEYPGYTIAGRDVIGKKGDLPGQTSFTYMDRTTGEAVILFTNGDLQLPYGVVDILAALFLHAEKLR
jgi:CubicO group peptidase (beta-lactamase class C family)